MVEPPLHPPAPPAAPTAAGLGRRLMSALYETLPLLALLMSGDLILLLALPAAASPALRPLVQIYLLTLAGAYFTWFWTHGGQTLPMKTWNIRLVSATDGAVNWRQATARYLLALVTLVLPSWLWALWDRDRQFLHDRLAGTRIVRIQDS